MASYLVDGLVLPIAITGHPALDFCNTRAGWGATGPKEYLHTHAHLALWSREHGLATPADLDRWHRAERQDPAAAAAVVTRALTMRSALYALLIGPAIRRDWDVVNTEIAAAAATATLAPGPATPPPAVPAPVADQLGNADVVVGGGIAAWRLSVAGLDGPLLAIAWSAAELLTSSTARSVRACPGDGCGWVFSDPRGRRRWCSMAWCGNRAKARRHAERQRPPER